jgi:hypothetical protein
MKNHMWVIKRGNKYYVKEGDDVSVYSTSLNNRAYLFETRKRARYNVQLGLRQSVTYKGDEKVVKVIKVNGKWVEA